MLRVTSLPSVRMEYAQPLTLYVLVVVPDTVHALTSTESAMGGRIESVFMSIVVRFVELKTSVKGERR